MHLRHATGTLLILLASALPGLGQGRTNPGKTMYSIAGMVRDDSDQHSMESVRVDLKQATGTPINSTFTRGSGEFEFSGIPNGDYTIEIIVRDYEPFHETVTIEQLRAPRPGLFSAQADGIGACKIQRNYFRARTEHSPQGAR